MSEKTFEDIRATLDQECRRIQKQVDEAAAVLKERKAQLRGLRGALARLSPQSTATLTLEEVIEHYAAAQRQDPSAPIETIREHVNQRVRSSGVSLSGIGLLRKRAEAALEEERVSA